MDSKRFNKLRKPNFDGIGGIARFCRRNSDIYQFSFDHEKDVMKDADLTNCNELRNNSVATSENKSLPMNKCINMLAPHLTSFRERCHSGNSKVSEMSNEQLSNYVPSQLLRVARFFHFKWNPIKRALLRPASNKEEEEVEIGLSIRILLAKALHSKGILSLAEVDSLSTSLQSPQNQRESRKTISIVDDIKKKFSQIHLEIASNGGNVAILQLRETLVKYCEWIDDKTKTSDQKNEDSITQEELADLALVAFSSIVLTNGLDCPAQQDTNCQYHAETKIVDIFADKSDLLSYIVKSINNRIVTLISYPSIDKLSSLNILCLGRYFSCISLSDVETYFIKSLLSCFKSGGGSGLASLPKLISVYLSISVEGPRKNHSPLSFEKNLMKEIQQIQIQQQQLSQSDTEVLTMFFNALMQASLYLLQNKGKNASKKMEI